VSRDSLTPGRADGAPPIGDSVVASEGVDLARLQSVTTRIPRIIHYCWLSGDPKPEIVQSCMESWQRHLPDYEIVCWDKNRFDVESVAFVKQACEARKWAFAADYIRLHALFHHGGVYLDSDVRVFKSFDPFLHHAAFSSVEFHPEMFNESIKKGSTAGLGIEAAVIGAEKHHPWIEHLLDYYTDKKFINDPDFYDNFIVSGIIADLSAASFGFTFRPIYQVMDHDVHLYPPDVFSRIGPENPVRYSSHLLAGSWRAPRERPLLIRAAKAVMGRFLPRWRPALGS
jgi:hypothetical protein